MGGTQITKYMKKELLEKYLKNSCTDKEFDEFVGWVKNETLEKEGESWGFDDWKSFDPNFKNRDYKKYSALLDRIHHKINLKNKKSKNTQVFNLRNMANWLSRAAAVLFIPLLGIVFYMYSNNHFQSDVYTDFAVDSLEIIAPIGSRTVVQLSDGTVVNLNFGSRIKYPRNFSGDYREITLSGEGYFDVAHNPDKPFIVKTGKLNIKALGTKFNVLAYPNDDIVATTLVEGKVVLEKTILGDNNQLVGTIIPGQHVSYNLKSGKITSTKGKIEKYIGWKDGKLIFDNEPITIVAERLSRMFNVDIEVADNVKYLTYSVTFVNDPLFLILDLMTETTPVTYKTFHRKKLANGTFSKQKIRIEKRH
jgi:ferric-dicitrate binding protein FerR (iron transport regulator)